MSILSQFKQSQNTDFPNVRPSLDLRFALAKKLDPRVTFTRASTATYFGPDGTMRTAAVNEPRFDHDPATGQSLGLLIEGSRTNLLVRSEDFSLWSIFNASVQSDAITAPDGNTTADKLVENSSTGYKEATRGSITFTSGASLTFSCFVKAGERKLFRLAATTGFFSAGTNAYFNLTSGTVSSINGGVTSASIIPYPNGWYRCVATMLPTSSGTGNVYITLVRSGTQLNYVGDGTSGIYIWGAQVEEGAFPTSYIPTVASTVTRSADNASVTGTNFSSWYNQTEGTIVSNCVSRVPSGTSSNATDFAVVNAFTPPYTSRVVGWFNTAATPYISVIANNNAVFLPFNGNPGPSANVPIKKAISLADRNMKVSVSGKIYTGDLGNAGVQDYLPTNFSRLLIGYEGVFTGYLNGTISRLTYYPLALTDEQLINLTS